MADLMAGDADYTTADILSRVPERLMARDIQRLVAKQRAGLPLEPGEAQALARHQAYQRDVGEPMAMEITGIPGFARSARQAYDEPSIGNIADAGMRGAMLAFRPAAALGFLGAGYADAAAKDFGLLGSAAQAADDGLNPDQRKRLRALQKKGSLTRAEREEQNQYLAIQAKQQEIMAGTAANERRLEAEGRAKQQDMQREEYDRAVRTAEAVRSRIEATNKSFKDSETGKFYEKSGGFTPVLAGFGAGLIGGAAHRAMGATPTKAAIASAAEGAGGTFAALNAPLLYDSFSTPTMNPQREALEAYSRELPPGHPRKAEYAGYAREMDKFNPVQTKAWDELTSPTANLRRLGVSAIEGGLAGLTGGLAPIGLAALPGQVSATYKKAFRGSPEDAAPAATAVRPAAPQPSGPELPGLLRQSQTYGDEVRQLESGGLLGPAPSSSQSAAPSALQAPQTAKRPQPKPATEPNQPALPPPNKQPRGWANVWSEPARKSVEDFITSNPGAPLAALDAPTLLRAIEAKLPEGVKAPSISTVKNYLSNLKKTLPEAPKLTDARKQWKADPRGLLFSGGAGALALPGLLGDGASP